MQLELLLSFLDGVKSAGAGYTARCPGHDDNRNSLSVSPGENGGIVLHCHAGCQTPAVLAALDLTMQDLAPARVDLRPRIVAEYPYTDERGEVLYEVLRYEPKDFRQRRADGSWKLGNVRRVLYRLPELTAADPSATVYICEGEKDCDRLAALGLIATTNAGGAGKWRDEYCEPLRGRSVVILPDNDEPGRQHAAKVQQALAGIAASVRIVNLPDLPPKGDVSDWLNAGGTRQRLESLAAAETVPATAAEPAKPEPRQQFPAELYRVPGFVGRVMDHCLEISPYPNVALAFCGAIALQAWLAARRVRDPGNVRSNIDLIALAYSGSGKDAPRKLNREVARSIGCEDQVADRFASGEAIEDALLTRPSMLIQTDEISSLLRSINSANDARHEGILATLLSVYSTSNSTMTTRLRAGQVEAQVVDQPSVVLFGTATPSDWYASCSARMLENGLISRCIIVEGGRRGEGQDPIVKDVPADILDTARWWSEFRPGGNGNLANWHPVPAVVEFTPEAKQLVAQARKDADAEYAIAEERGDAVATAILSRVHENGRKLALLRAVSQNHMAAIIDADCIRWGTDFALRHAKRVLEAAASRVSENPFHELCLRLMAKVRESPGRSLPHSIALKRMKTDSQTFRRIVDTLVSQGDLVIASGSAGSRGPGGIEYRLAT